MLPDIRVMKVLLYNRPIGTLTHLPGDKNLFTFNEDYVQNPSRPTLSLSFKDTSGALITNIKTTQTRLPSFFSNLLPEGPLREYLAQRAQIHPQHEFFLLWALGRDLPGALTVEAFDEGSFLQSTVKIHHKKKKEIPLRFSLAGLQLKFSAVASSGHRFTIPVDGIGGGWIVKLPHTTFPGVPENEYTMMELARRVGINVPETHLLPIHTLQELPKEFERLGQNVFVIKRFDRTEEGECIHIEDCAQVFGVYPENKYQSANYRNIAKVIANETGESGVVEFIKRFVFNALIGNGDMHLKNWSLIYSQKHQPSLAPAYDFVSTILYLPEDALALNFVDNKDFTSLTFDQFKRFAAKAHLSEKLVLHTVKETVETFSESWKTVKDLPVHKDVQAAILKHLSTLPIWNAKSSQVMKDF